jgi:AcrR family transcriptional regulator
MMPDAKQKTRVSGRPRDPAADEAILRTAIQLFLEEGIEAVCIDQIAKRTGISRAPIYRRWSDREDVLVHALLQIAEQRNRSWKLAAGATQAVAVKFMEDRLLDSLMEHEGQRFTAHAMGAIPGFPKVMAVYQEQFVVPWRRALGDALIVAHETSASAKSNELLIDIMSGAIMQRLLMRTHAPSPKRERAWVKSLLQQLGVQA